MSAELTPKCSYCGSYYLSTISSENKKRCIDCGNEFDSSDKQVVVNNRIKNVDYPFQSCGFNVSVKNGQIEKVEKFPKD